MTLAINTPMPAAALPAASVGAPAPPPPAAAAAPAAASADTYAALVAQLTTLLQALIGRQQLASPVASATGGGGPATAFVDPGYSRGGTSNLYGFTVEGSPFAGTGNPPTTPPPDTIAGGGPAPATTGPTGTPGAMTTINPDLLLGTPKPGGVIAAVVAAAKPDAAMEMSEGQWITITDGAAQMHVHAHGEYVANPGLIQGAIQSGKIQVHLHPDGTAHLHDVM